MNERILSVITNFGCDTGCKYCIWKKHSLHNVHTTENLTDWDLLKTLIRDHSKNQISVSGGVIHFTNTKKMMDGGTDCLMFVEMKQK